MNAHDAIKQAYGFSQMVLNSYVSDLTDTELLQRPGEGCNHIAWQLGHLISSECGLLNAAVPGSGLELPAGFAENHSKENAASDDAAQFCSKAQYLDLFQKMQTATFAALDGLSDSDLDQPGPEHMRDFCPTMGSLFILISTHVMMHMGQLVPIRRRLGKPVLI